MRQTRRRARTVRKKRNLYIGGSAGSPCVIVNLTDRAGLGNQLFMYAAGIVAKNKTGLPLCVLPTKGNYHSKTDYRFLFKQGTPVDEGVMGQRISSAVKVHNSIQHDPHGEWSNTHLPTNTSRNILMNGIYYQNYKSIHTALPQMRKDFSEKFAELYPGFKESVFKGTSPDATACMHVRRGDYGSQSLPASYYTAAIHEVNKVRSIKTLYILSDDVEYCKEQIESKVWQPNAEVRWIDDPKDELKALYLMSLCVGGIIMSNSTFSCWGAFLGADRVPDSIIVYPKKWITGNSKRLQFPAQVNKKWMSL